jgi:hypothetical protein
MIHLLKYLVNIHNKNFNQIKSTFFIVFLLVLPITFVESMKNPNTKRKTNSDTHIFMEWLIANNETRLPEEIEKQNLHK